VRLSILFFVLALGPTACTTPCNAPANDADRAELCETHPFGRAPYCGGVEEPQTFEACMTVQRANAGICTSDYVACRDALREAPCEVCPVECADVVSAC
jgi:hypothetical protein